MPRPARRPLRCAPRLEILELRSLLSGIPFGPQSLESSATAAPNPSDEVLVRFSASDSAEQVQAALQAVGGQILQSYPDGPDLVALAAGSDVGAAIRVLESEPGVVYAEANAPIHESAIYPPDPMFPQQWGLNNTNDVDIDAPEAWSVTTGNPSTIIAVLDTGIDLHNPDLASRVWVNPNSSGSDGYPGDVFGWDFTTNTNNVQDNNGHGSHVAGIIGAAAFNGVGTVGVNWNAKLMDVKVLDAAGNGTTDQAVAGIYYAVNHGARVINASWGGGEYSQAMIDAIDYADSKGVVFVTAAGNNGTNNDVIPTYPASYRLPNELVVAAVDQNGNLASFSDYGAHTVDLAAPGVNIQSTVIGGYASYSGTSMATPFVSGVVSLVLGLYPQWTAEQAIQRVMATVKPLPSLQGTTISGGMVDAAQAVGVPGSGQNGGGPFAVAAAQQAIAQAEAQTLVPLTPAKAHAKKKPATHPKHVATHKPTITHHGLPAQSHTVRPARVAQLEAASLHDPVVLGA